MIVEEISAGGRGGVEHHDMKCELMAHFGPCDIYFYFTIIQYKIARLPLHFINTLTAHVILFI